MKRPIVKELHNIIVKAPVGVIDGHECVLGSIMNSMDIAMLAHKIHDEIRIHIEVFGDIQIDGKKLQKCIFDILGKDGEYWRQDIIKNKRNLCQKLEGSVGVIVDSGAFKLIKI